MKNKSFYTIFILLLTLLGSSAIFAQSQSIRAFRMMPPQEKAELQAEVTSERLGLNETQQESIQAIYLKYTQKRVALRKQMKHSPERKELMRKMNQSQAREIKTVLSESQRATYTKILSGEAPKLNFRSRMSVE